MIQEPIETKRGDGTTKIQEAIDALVVNIKEFPDSWILTYYASNCYHAYSKMLDISISVSRQVGYFSEDFGILVSLGTDDMKEILENDDVGVFYITSSRRIIS